MSRENPVSAGRGVLMALGGLATLLVGCLLLAIAAYGMCVIHVPAKHIAILTRKTGLDLSNDQLIAPTPEHKGVQREVLTEGRYFRDPYHWTWRIVPQVEIPAGKIGVQVRLAGEDLPEGQFVVSSDQQKGILPGDLMPGRYPINTVEYMVEEVDPVTIEAGYQGVLTSLAGPLADNPNVLLVNDGERGTQKKTLREGTRPVNPYVFRVNKVDCRSQRFNVAEHKDFGFPSKDGFWVGLDAVIEFRLAPERVAEVYVTYNEAFNGDSIDEEIINKVILPNARSFCRLEGSNTLGKDFIGNRRGFQDRFQLELQEACKESGVEIIQALITKIVPPEQIAAPIQEREIAKQTEKQYQQQILQQESERRRKNEEEMVKQKQALVEAEQTVVRVTTEAMQAQEVAVTKANQELAVAQLKLDASKDQAEAVLARGRAAAEVQAFQNEAEASGWKRSVEAFGGDGGQFAQYVLYQKLSTAYRSIMVNTADSPIMEIFDSFTQPGATPIRPATAPATPARGSTGTTSTTP